MDRRGAGGPFFIFVKDDRWYAVWRLLAFTACVAERSLGCAGNRDNPLVGALAIRTLRAWAHITLS